MTALLRGIYAIVDGDRLGLATHEGARPPVNVIRAYAEAAAEAGAVAVQIRLKHLPLGHPTRLTALNAVRRALGGRIAVIADDDLSAATGAHTGLHLGQDDGDPRAARRLLDPDALLGWSTHTLAQVVAAQALPVHYLGFGPVRATDGKQGHAAATGIAGLAQAVTASRLPIVAIGGLTRADVTDVKRAGAHAMAVIGAWLGPAGRPHDVATARAHLQDLVAEFGQ
jgi:thiamine-phosphate pyrophosphorylase